MNRAMRACATLAVVLTALLLLPSTATAASNDIIQDLDIEIEIRPDGTLEVTETYDWDFGARNGLGLTRELDARFDYEPDDGKVRVYEYDDFAVTSPTGAPAGVWPRDSGPRVRVDVGAPDGSDDRRTGRQTYVLTYTVGGALNAIRDQEGVADQDELYWNATGHDWSIPIEQASVTVTGPTSVVDHACYLGSRGSSDSCTTLDAEGAQVSATSGRLRPGEGLTIMAAYPPGTFGDIAPILQDRADGLLGSDDGATSAVARFVRGNLIWLVPLGLAIPVLYGVSRVRRGRDRYFADLPPGILPAAGSTPRVEQLRDEPVVAVRFTPPDHLRPGEVGALDNKGAATTHVSATLIDLAVRGYLRLHEASTNWRGDPNDWLLVATPEQARADQLRDYERTLLQKIFSGRSQVRMSELQNTFAGTMRTARRQLAAGLRELFTKPLKNRGTRFPLVPLVIFGVIFLNVTGGLGAAAAGGSSVVFLVLVGVILLVAMGVAAAVTRKARTQRSPTGRALHEQSRGFELYLTTAEAHQLRFEEGEDIFSRYLPYAMVYGVAERWAGIIADLEAQGAPVSRPTWYVSPHGFRGSSFRSLGSSMSSFSARASSTLSSTPGSSGGSGSGGGGSSGGGGGGGGGGGR